MLPGCVILDQPVGRRNSVLSAVLLLAEFVNVLVPVETDFFCWSDLDRGFDCERAVSVYVDKLRAPVLALSERKGRLASALAFRRLAVL